MSLAPWSKKFAKSKQGELKKFLADAERHERVQGFEESVISGKEIFEYSARGWQYSHERTVGLPQSGTVTAAYMGEVRWEMHYFGRTIGKVNVEEIALTLNEALEHIDSTMPIRGPKDWFAENGLSYHNSYNGDLSYFRGKEVVFNKHATTLYELDYQGGFVNLK